LDLSQNAIRIVEFEFMHMTNLTLLDISQNLLTVLNDTLQSQYSEMFKTVSKKLRLDLSGNPFQCSCDTLGFLQWLQRYNEARLIGFAKYSCFYSNKLVPFSNLSNYILVELEYDCNTRAAVIVAGVLVGIALLSVTTSAFCYRYRWEIRYFCLKLTQKGKRYQQLISSETQYEYDAFVVYDSDDRDWVISELVPNLEQSHPGPTTDDEVTEDPSFRTVRLCIHERDFQPGEHIISNIWNKLERCRKVVLIVSNNFAKSKYCDYEMNLANVLSVEQSRDVLVPVLLDLPDVETVSSTLHGILRTVTYIEWPRCEGQEREHFWTKLRAAIGTNQQEA
jgi:toll-like receptor 13